MSRRIPSARAVFVVAILSLSTAFAASTEHIAYNFNGAPNGSHPSARLITDIHGDLYGTAATGCEFNYGCVFKLSKLSGSWSETVLYSFSGPDGSTPASSLVLDSSGNLYGTTAIGGDYNLGVAFKLAPSATGDWTETVLHSFGNGTDGYQPCELILDAGSFYGITQFGGTASSGPNNGGTVFRLSDKAGVWTETILYSFPGNFFGPDGDLPIGGLARGSNGVLYGVTQAGGAHGYGTVFALTPGSGGTFKEKILHSFNIVDGDLPNSTPVADATGNLYGTTYYGGDTKTCQPNGCGTVYELQKNSNGSWTLISLRQLQGIDGSEAVGPVAFDSAGDLYAAGQADAEGWGSIFKLTRSPKTPWPETIVHLFTNDPDGATPYAGLTFDIYGNLYGTTYSGGRNQMGTIYGVGK